MSEREPRTPKFKVEFANGDKYVCTPRDTMAYLHSKLPASDHLWITQNFDPEADANGVPLFREQISNFNEILGYMKANGYSIVEPDTGIPSDSDLAMYHRYLATKPIQPEGDPNPLTPRQERLADFMAYLLLKEHLAVEDFDGEGELYI